MYLHFGQNWKLLSVALSYKRGHIWWHPSKAKSQRATVFQEQLQKIFSIYFGPSTKDHKAQLGSELKPLQLHKGGHK